MTVVGFNFTKMLAEKQKPVKGQINIRTNVLIKDVSKSKMTMDAKKDALKFNFAYISNYEPEIGKVELEGETVFLLDKKAAEETMKAWKKDKKVPDDIMRELMGHISMKCSVQAIVLTKDINLPAPIPLPKVK